MGSAHARAAAARPRTAPQRSTAGGATPLAAADMRRSTSPLVAAAQTRVHPPRTPPPAVPRMLLFCTARLCPAPPALLLRLTEREPPWVSECARGMCCGVCVAGADTAAPPLAHTPPHHRCRRWARHERHSAARPERCGVALQRRGHWHRQQDSTATATQGVVYTHAAAAPAGRGGIAPAAAPPAPHHPATATQAVARTRPLPQKTRAGPPPPRPARSAAQRAVTLQAPHMTAAAPAREPRRSVRRRPRSRNAPQSAGLAPACIARRSDEPLR